jgi:hypothetical protein
MGLSRSEREGPIFVRPMLRRCPVSTCDNDGLRKAPGFLPLN